MKRDNCTREDRRRSRADFTKNYTDIAHAVRVWRETQL